MQVTSVEQNYVLIAMDFPGIRDRDPTVARPWKTPGEPKTVALGSIVVILMGGFRWQLRRFETV